MADAAATTQPVQDRLAPYAVSSSDGGARYHPEPDHPLRDPFEVDRQRIVHSAAFRRLEGKTQVFAPDAHDHFRTRLTHTFEVSHVARLLARNLGVNERLAEAIALAHDLGHPPFGHAGEAALHSMMTSHGGFNHNTHALHVVDYLEHPFPSFRGLNLTNVTRAGLLSHATPYDQPAAPSGGETNTKSALFDSTPSGGRTSKTPHPEGASVEARIVSLADRIAYNLHDLEDAIGAALLNESDLARIPLWQNAYTKQSARFPDCSVHALRRLVLDTMLDGLLTDAKITSLTNLENIRTRDDLQKTSGPIVVLSDTAMQRLNEVEAFLTQNVYRRATIAQTDADGQHMIRALFNAYLDDPLKMPERFASRIENQGVHRVVCDYIAGMTDKFCRSHFEELTQSP